MGLGKGYDIALAVIIVAWAALCMWLAAQGAKNKKKPNPKFEKVPIIIGISIPVLIGILAIIAEAFF